MEGLDNVARRDGFEFYQRFLQVGRYCSDVLSRFDVEKPSLGEGDERVARLEDFIEKKIYGFSDGVVIVENIEDEEDKNNE